MTATYSVKGALFRFLLRADLIPSDAAYAPVRPEQLPWFDFAKLVRNRMKCLPASSCSQALETIANLTALASLTPFDYSDLLAAMRQFSEGES